MLASSDDLEELYADTQTCARLVGLDYISEAAKGLKRVKKGKGFSYFDDRDRLVADAKLKQRIAELVIPPAWQEVWICPSASGHILATGIDEKGRKQYIYHPKWRTMRDLIKFYRLLVFAGALPKIRAAVEANLDKQGLTREKILAVMLWVLDNAYIRIGNETYFQENDSVGLTTLIDDNVAIAGPVVTLTFKGKSGKQQQITFEDDKIAELLSVLRAMRGARLFRYKDGQGWHPIESSDINSYLYELTGSHITAKDFRTWGGTLMAFLRLIEEEKKAKPKKAEKVIIEAVDQAAAILGNTRAVARSSYVHPDILSVYASKDFGRYYNSAKGHKRIGLGKHESELYKFLKQLFEREFNLLKEK